MSEAPLLSLRGIGRTYGGEVPTVALAEVDLDVTRGEMLSLVGPSGSGKSTLLNLLALLDRPTTGTCAVDGRQVETWPERRRAALRAATFGFVFQRFHLVERYTAVDNVALGQLYQHRTRRDRRRAAREALDRVGLGERGDHRAEQLSGGERQRVAIARALVGGAPVLVADEPTGNLDAATSQAIVDLVVALNREGTTVILVTHDPEVAAVAPRQVRLRDGRLVEPGR